MEIAVLSSRKSRLQRLAEPPVTDDEINVLMEQGAEAGVFHESEQEIVSNVLRLYVPDSVTTTQLLESLRKARSQIALIVDEYGELEGG